MPPGSATPKKNNLLNYKFNHAHEPVFGHEEARFEPVQRGTENG